MSKPLESNCQKKGEFTWRKQNMAKQLNMPKLSAQKSDPGYGSGLWIVICHSGHKPALGSGIWLGRTRKVI